MPTNLIIVRLLLPERNLITIIKTRIRTTDIAHQVQYHRNHPPQSLTVLYNFLLHTRNNMRNSKKQYQHHPITEPRNRMHLKGIRPLLYYPLLFLGVLSTGSRGSNCSPILSTPSMANSVQSKLPLYSRTRGLRH